MQKKARPLLIAATVAGVCIVGGLLTAGPRPPSYKGRTLAGWIRGMHSEGLSVEHVQALQAMGTNATPLLLKWMRYETPPWKVTVFKVTNKARALLKKDPIDDQAEFLADDATDAIWILQKEAPTLFTECTNIMLDTKLSSQVQKRAYGLLFKHAWRDPILMPWLQEQLDATSALEAAQNLTNSSRH